VRRAPTTSGYGASGGGRGHCATECRWCVGEQVDDALLAYIPVGEAEGPVLTVVCSARVKVILVGQPLDGDEGGAAARRTTGKQAAREWQSGRGRGSPFVSRWTKTFFRPLEKVVHKARQETARAGLTFIGRKERTARPEQGVCLSSPLLAKRDDGRVEAGPKPVDQRSADALVHGRLSGTCACDERARNAEFPRALSERNLWRKARVSENGKLQQSTQSIWPTSATLRLRGCSPKRLEQYRL